MPSTQLGLALDPVVTMPKIPVNKYNDSCSLENDVRLTWKIKSVCVIPQTAAPQRSA